MNSRAERLRNVACSPIRALPQSYAVMRGRHIVKKVAAPVSGEIIFSPMAERVGKRAVLEASLIRNRKVLEELAKH